MRAHPRYPLGRHQGVLRRRGDRHAQQGVSARLARPHHRPLYRHSTMSAASLARCTARTSMVPSCPIRSAPCGRSPSLVPTAHQSATFISAAPAVTLAPASRWRPGAMPPRSSAAILASLSLATVRRNRIRRHPLPELLYRPLQRAGRARHDALLACALLHQAISAPKLWNPRRWQIVAE